MSFGHDSILSGGSSGSREGLAMNWVLDHVLAYPATYDFALPLRTIYILNSTTPHTSPADFKLLLLEHISNLPSQPCTLPPSFLSTFVRKCFPRDLENVQFDQAFTALDYIRDLEVRRSKELEKAARARGEGDRRIVNLRVKSIRTEQFYARAIAGIRRWTLLHELSITPFNKFNCIAILNTLYPIEEADINSYLPAPTLASQRHALWRYITGVEKNGPGILESVRTSNGGWAGVSEAVNAYLRLSLDMIQKADELARPSSIGSFRSDDSMDMGATSIAHTAPERKRKKGGFLRRDTISSETSEEEDGKASTLERIVRGLARLGSSQQHLGSPKKLYESDAGSEEDFPMRYD
ncbi:unnamed protein product [Tuber melanosporum]|jgi:hypothetical protein|uniref:(Perigord truffle) hypothetical protein n=1 Tax=Tuber melanosporum (strain Mel28) TaxID=656061 RepID=D5GB78_TUBMM|nr:uncharacterized protein GSTUM_00003779001 [Tuber melanosporum]KAG0132884.1 hypothetical protein HOY82DRAFT_277121 [Tuber indicum]CAZ81771.1 unnamed protein product [Tuber melanosporum]